MIQKNDQELAKYIINTVEESQLLDFLSTVDHTISFPTDTAKQLEKLYNNIQQKKYHFNNRISDKFLERFLVESDIYLTAFDALLFPSKIDGHFILPTELKISQPEQYLEHKKIIRDSAQRTFTALSELLDHFCEIIN